MNGKDTEDMETATDLLQETKVELTGKPFAFKVFHKGGNLIALNSDMDVAQVIGAVHSFLKRSDPVHSSVSRDTSPSQVAPYCVKLCHTHFKRAILNFAPLVDTKDYKRLLGVVDLKSRQAIDEFTQFVASLGIPKISNWWKHKIDSDWILPCVIKSQSLIPADDWDQADKTTNLNEAQHAWTKARTGIKLSLVEGMESARKLDSQVVRERAVALSSGVDVNPNNGSYQRRARNTTRRANAAAKAHVNKSEGKNSGKKAGKKRGGGGEQLRKSAGTALSNTETMIVSSSSSGRVKTRIVPAKRLPPTETTPAIKPVSVVTAQGTVHLGDDLLLTGEPSGSPIDYSVDFNPAFTPVTLSDEEVNSMISFGNFSVPDLTSMLPMFPCDYDATEPVTLDEYGMPPLPTFYGQPASPLLIDPERRLPSPPRSPSPTAAVSEQTTESSRPVSSPGGRTMGSRKRKIPQPAEPSRASKRQRKAVERLNL
ncbi:unnamed protein product [Mycena citricolor]|nr:unnamed protein product [Mycena citricolor]